LKIGLVKRVPRVKEIPVVSGASQKQRVLRALARLADITQSSGYLALRTRSAFVASEAFKPNIRGAIWSLLFPKTPSDFSRPMESLVTPNS